MFLSHSLRSITMWLFAPLINCAQANDYMSVHVWNDIWQGKFYLDNMQTNPFFVLGVRTSSPCVVLHHSRQPELGFHDQYCQTVVQCSLLLMRISNISIPCTVKLPSIVRYRSQTSSHSQLNISLLNTYPTALVLHVLSVFDGFPPGSLISSHCLKNMPVGRLAIPNWLYVCMVPCNELAESWVNSHITPNVPMIRSWPW